MNMAYGFEEIASGCAGLPGGGNYGNRYDNVEVSVRKRGGAFRAVALHTWGSNQGYLEEQGREETAAWSADPRAALDAVVLRAQRVIDHEAHRWLTLAASECEEELEAYLASDAEQGRHVPLGENP